LARSQQAIVLQPIPIHHVEAIWRTIEPGLVRAIKDGGSEYRPETVKASVVGGQFIIWVALKEEKYAGFLMTEPIVTDYSVWLNVPYAYGVPELSDDVREVAMQTLESHADSMGWRGVKFISARKGFERVAKKMGYEKRIVEWVKET